LKLSIVFKKCGVGKVISPGYQSGKIVYQESNTNKIWLFHISLHRCAF